MQRKERKKSTLKKTKQIQSKHYVYRLDRQMDTLRLLMYLLKKWFHPYLPILIDMVQFNQEKELT